MTQKEKTSKVMESFENDLEDRCVDFFVRDDGTFGFEEYRRDKETHEGWYKIYSYGHYVYFSEQEALTNAYKKVSWLKEKVSKTDLKK